MANVQAPFGFRPTSLLAGAAPNYMVSQAQIAFDNANDIGTGDVVILGNNGYIDIATSSTGVNYGIFIGCQYMDSTLQRTVFSPAWRGPVSGAIGPVYANVITDPNALFEVQVGGSTSVGAVQADVGENISFGGNGAPNTSGQSTAYVDITTADGSVTTRAFRIVALSPRVNNDITAAYDTVVVAWNNQFFKQLAGS